MPIDYYPKVWHNGDMIPWEKATLHVASHVITFASCVFEGIRCYQTPKGPAIFRLQEHMERLVNSARIYRMDLAYSADQLCNAAVELMRVNLAQHAYLRPLVVRGYGEAGVNPMNNPLEVYLLSWKWGKYLGAEALQQGVDVCISSWNRIAPNTLPSISKAAANYMNAQLIQMEAAINGYTEGIALDSSGNVSEGSGENLFLVKEGKLFTPPLASSVLPGITRASVLQLAAYLGYEVAEQPLPREMLYIADEVFFCGTAAEITPIRSIDRIVVGTGKIGTVTLKLQQQYLSIAEGKVPDPFRWLTYC